MEPSERGWDLIRVSVALATLNLVAVVLRFVARSVRKLSLELDDWLALACLPFIMALLTEAVLFSTIAGAGYHIQDILVMNGSSQIVSNGHKIILASECTHTIAVSLIKLTILFFYRRIFPTPKFLRATSILLGLCAAWGVSTLIVCLTQCTPLSAFWSPDTDAAVSCIDQNVFLLISQLFNALLDMAVLIVPLPLIWGLPRPKQDRIAIGGVFLLGSFACFASLYRIVMLSQLNLYDTTYDLVFNGIWLFVEPSVGLTCACLPVIRGLLPAGTKKRATPSPQLTITPKSPALMSKLPLPLRRGYVELDGSQEPVGKGT